MGKIILLALGRNQILPEHQDYFCTIQAIKRWGYLSYSSRKCHNNKMVVVDSVRKKMLNSRDAVELKVHHKNRHPPLFLVGIYQDEIPTKV